MALVTKTYTFVAGTTIVASEHNTNLDTLFNLVNGNIDNANIKASAGIVDSKLAQLTTAGKVSGAALTSLTSIPSGAGLIPVANIDTGTTASKILKLDGDAKIPAVDGSLLTNLGVALASILDYGTSASASTARAQTALRICWGSLSITGNSNSSLSNLPFTSSSSYVIIGTFGTATDATEAVVITRGSGSAATIYNNDNQTQTIMWIALGI